MLRSEQRPAIRAFEQLVDFRRRCKRKSNAHSAFRTALFLRFFHRRAGSTVGIIRIARTFCSQGRQTILAAICLIEGFRAESCAAVIRRVPLCGPGTDMLARRYFKPCEVMAKRLRRPDAWIGGGSDAALLVGAAQNPGRSENDRRPVLPYSLGRRTARRSPL